MICEWGNSKGPFTCVSCGIVRSKPVNRRCNQGKPTPKRTEDQQLDIAVTHCSTCENFQDAESFNKIKCRNVGSCGCLWGRLGSSLFGCPDGKFTRDESIITAYNAPPNT